MSLGFIKILRDLWVNRARTGLVVLSIALSVGSFGILNTTRAVIMENYMTAYRQAEPAQVILTLRDFDQALLDKVRRLPEVRLAEGRRVFDLKFTSGRAVYNINAFASRDPLADRVARLDWRTDRLNEQIAAPAALGKGDVLLDGTFKALMPVTAGQQIMVESTDGHRYPLTVTGLPNDLISMPTQYTLAGSAFVNLDTAEYLGQPRAFNRLYIVTQAGSDDLAARQIQIQDQAERIAHELTDAGYPVMAVEIPVTGRPALYNLLNAMLLLVQLFGLLIVVITVLVVSVVAAALIAEQTSQVGILKALGSSAIGVLVIYSQMVLIIGGAALLIAMPLVWGIAYWGVGMLARQLDTPVLSFSIPLSTWISLPLLAFGATLAAVFSPLWRAAHLSIRQAVSEEPPHTAGRVVLSVGSIRVRSSLRTLLRKRQRLLLNLMMLSLGGAMFITALNIRSEIRTVGARIQQRNNFDMFVGLSETVKRSALEQTTRTVAGVSDAQAYLTGSVGRVLPGGAHTGVVPVMAVPAESDYHQLALITGQWPPPRNGIVLSSEALEVWGLPVDPLPPIGTPLRVSIAGRQTDWVLAGVMGKVTRPVAYAPYEAYAALTGQVGMANIVAIRLAPGENREHAAAGLPKALEQVGYAVLYSDDVPHSNAAQMSAFNIPVYALMGIVALIAIVGGLGLSSTLSINVMERRREIGILRSMGADPGMVRRLILTEGLLIALISLPVAWLLAWPMTLVMGRVVVLATVGFVPPLIYLPWAGLAWSGLVCGLALLSSWMPAHQAGRLSIREALIYTG